MSKISNAFLMVDLLNSGNKYTVKELSEILNISERMVRYYKEELEKIGIYIESFKGPNGGYFILDNKGYYNRITKYDIELLENIYKELKKDNYKFIDKLLALLTKIKNLYQIEEEKSKFIIENNLEESDKITTILQKCINSKESIEIMYENLGGELKKRIIHPIYIFNYKDIKYVTAYCELRNDIRHFEFSRIKLSKQ